MHYRIWWDGDTNILELEPHESLGYKLNAEKLSVRNLPADIPKGRFPAKWDKKRKCIVVEFTKS